MAHPKRIIIKIVKPQGEVTVTLSLSTKINIKVEMPKLMIPNQQRTKIRKGVIYFTPPAIYNNRKIGGISLGKRAEKWESKAVKIMEDARNKKILASGMRPIIENPFENKFCRDSAAPVTLARGFKE